MQAGSLVAALEREHHEIDETIAAFAAAVSPADEDRQSLRRAIHALRRHIYLEEEFLFPLLREVEPALMAAIFVMLREHAQIWATLDLLEREIAAGADAGARCRQLKVQLLHHNLQEERVLYQRADDLLTATAAKRLRKVSESARLPAGWMCIKARG